MWRIEFTSSLFLPTLPPECQVNPGVYGHELSLCLARSLAGRGITPSYPCAEDWGWFFECTQDGLEVQIGCSSLCDDGQGYDGQAIDWSVFVKPHRSIRKMFSRSPEVAAPSFLTEAIESVLVAQGIAVRVVER